MNWVVYAVIVVVTAYLSLALSPKPPSQKPANLDDFNIPTAEPGRPIPVAFGDVVITGVNVVWFGDLASTPIYSEGGK